MIIIALGLLPACAGVVAFFIRATGVRRFLLVAVAAGLACNLSRLLDFRYSAKAARGREMEARRVAGETLTEAEKTQAKDGSRHSKLADGFGISTWCLLVAQLTAFFVGVLLMSRCVQQTYWGG